MIGPLAGAAPCDRLVAGGLHRAHIHAVDLLAGNVEGGAALGKIGLRRRARHRRAHGVAVVLDDVDHRQLPQLRHVEALVDLALVGGAVAEIGQADEVIAAIAVGEGKAGAERHLRADDAVAAVEILLLAEHVHGAALALGIAAAAAGQFGHHALGFHAAGQHVAVVAVAGDDLIALLQRHLHADDDGFLADIEMAEAADQRPCRRAGRPFPRSGGSAACRAARRSSCSLVNSGGAVGAVPLFLPVSLWRFFSVRPWQFRMREWNSPLYPNSNRHERIA